MTRGAFKEKAFLDKLFIYLILFIFLFADSSNKYLQYSNLFIALLFSIYSLIIRRDKFKYPSKKILIFPALLLIFWLYGVIVGLLNNNEYVFINNIGIIFFLSYYFFNTLRLSVFDIFKILFNVSIVSIFSYFSKIANLKNALFAFYLNYNAGDRFAYNIQGIFPFVIFPILVYNIFYKKKDLLLIKSKFINYFLFFLLLILAIFFVASKGIYIFILSTFFILFISNFHKKKIFSLFFILLIALTLFNISEQITIFGISDPSNENRYKQFDAVLSELTFYGKGWGAKYISNDLDRDELGYSIELSYFNLIHKIGIFSLVFFIFYFLMFVKIFLLLRSNLLINKEVALLCLGITSYLFISIGNPSLFAPIFIFLNCIFLILLNKTYLYDNKF